MKYFLLVLFWFSLNFTFAQPFVLSWEKTYNDTMYPHYEAIFGSSSTQTGDFWIAGEKLSSLGPMLFIRKYSPTGNLLVDKSYNATLPQMMRGMVSTCDIHGNIYVGGKIYLSNHSDFLVMKFDLSGNLVWQFVYDGIWHGDDAVYGLSADSLENIYVAGGSAPDTSNNFISIATVMRIKSSGSLDWTANPNMRIDFKPGFSMIPVNNNRLNVIGSDLFQGDFHLCAFDSTGMLYERTIISQLNLNGLAFDSIGNAFISLYSFPQNTYSITMFDTAGLQVWTSPTSVRCTQLLAGDKIYATGSYGNIITILKLDLSGNILWSSDYVASQASDATANSLTDVQGKIIGAFDLAIAAGSTETMLLEIDSLGAVIHATNYNYCAGSNYIASTSKNTNGAFLLTLNSLCPYVDWKTIALGTDTTLQFNFVNIINNWQDGYENPSGVLLDSNRNVVVGVNLTDTSGAATCRILTYDSSGNLISVVPVINSDHLRFNLQNVSINNSGNYILSGVSQISTDNKDHPTVFNVNSSGQIIFRYVYSGDEPYAEQLSHSTDNFGNTYLSGMDAPGGSTFLLKLDSQGDTAWTRIINSPGFGSLPSNMIKSGSSIFLLRTVFLPNNYELYFTEFDTSGNLLLNNLVPNTDSPLGIRGSILRDGNGDFLISSQRGDTFISGLNCSAWFILKIDSTGNIIWQNTISGNMNIGGKPIKLVTDENNNSFISGHYNYSLTAEQALTIKFDTNGNIIWRDSIADLFPVDLQYLNGSLYISGYNIFSHTNYIVVYDTLGQIQFTDSVPDTYMSSYLMADSTAFYFSAPLSTHSNNNDVLLRKYLNTLTSVNGQNGGDLNHIEVYPNPAGKYFTLEIENNNKENYILCLMNDNGAIVFKKQINATKTTIDVSDFPSGIYFGEVISALGKKHKTFKVAVLK